MIILVLLYKSGQNHKNQGIIRAIFCKCPDIRALPGLGKPHHKNIAVHLGIAQIAIGPPSPHSNGHSVAPIFGQNHANARLY